MAENRSHPGFSEVVLYKKEVIGIGSYGSVCKAKCDDLICAAKILHPTLIVDQPGERAPQARFQRECEFLSSLRHPHVVQYLGTCRDRDTGLPVLLMELMDHSLTQLLETRPPQEPLPFHVQVSVCHDVALALSFLHSNHIIHRDLSSNNVLMIGDRRAKVTDFGMARLVDINPKATRLSFSMCPGTDVYMPPEAVKETPQYTEKLDCFSFGVLTLQIMSCKFPSPGNRVKAVIIGGRELLEPQTEFSRREEDIKIIDPNNPLLPLACDCLKDKEADRPSARELNVSIARLKEDTAYSSSKEDSSPDKVTKLRSELEELRTTLREKESQIQSMADSEKQILDSKNAELRDLEEAKNAEIAALEETMNAEIDSLKTSLTAALEQNLMYKYKTAVTELTRATKPEPTTPTKRSGHEKISLKWRKGGDAPCTLTCDSDAVVCGNFVYARPGSSQQLLVYNFETDSWSQLLHCPTSYSTFASVKNSLVTIGGYDSLGEKTNKLYSLSLANQNFVWMEVYPPMPTKRDSAIATCCGGYLIVAGGIGKGYLKTVEVLQLDSSQWHAAASLPFKVFSGSAVVCRDRLYVLGGLSAVGTITYSVTSCSLGALIDSCSQQNASKNHPASPSAEGAGVWESNALLPAAKPACVSFQNHLLAIGGQDKFTSEPSKKVWAYEAGTWEEVGECEVARSQCFAAVLPGDQLLVAGGFTARYLSGDTSSTEIGSCVEETAS